MASVRLIKRNEVTAQPKRAPSQAASARSIIKEWMKKYQTTQPAHARAAFAALFTQPQIS